MPRKLRCATAAVGAAAIAIPLVSGARAQTRRPMAVDDLIAAVRVGDPQLSPDGRRVPPTSVPAADRDCGCSSGILRRVGPGPRGRRSGTTAWAGAHPTKADTRREGFPRSGQLTAHDRRGARLRVEAGRWRYAYRLFHAGNRSETPDSTSQSKPCGKR